MENYGKYILSRGVTHPNRTSTVRDRGVSRGMPASRPVQACWAVHYLCVFGLPSALPPGINLKATQRDAEMILSQVSTVARWRRVTLMLLVQF